VNTPSAEADGFTRPLEVGRRRLAPTEGLTWPSSRACIAASPRAATLERQEHGSDARPNGRHQAQLFSRHLPGFMLKLLPEGEGFNPPKVRQ
jgi:hypothetical protein